jgi:hypothetical protein
MLTSVQILFRFSIHLRATMSLKHDQRRPMPEWLARLNPAELEAFGFPLNQALQHSLYYPAAGFDGRPVQFLGGFIQSFVYIDYGLEERAVDAEVRTPGLWAIISAAGNV